MTDNFNGEPATAPIPLGSRRRSFLEMGGVNSLQNFASSFARAQSYSGLNFLEPVPSVLEGEISPLTSPPPDLLISDPFEGDEESGPPQSQGHDHINSYHFPTDNEAGEHDPLIRRDSKLGSISERLYIGNSTSYQTIFNSINTLMGMAMLSLPLGFKLVGWVLGTVIIIFSAAITNITAKYLGKILKKHPQLTSYGDIAQLYGGAKVNLIVTTIFSLDLLGASLSFIIIFGDSFNILFPSISKSTFKFIVIALLFVSTFLPLSILSFLSMFGIFCTTAIIVTIITCGLITNVSPGSLLSPSTTSWWPSTWEAFFFSLGLFMAPWGGHPVFPELYRDMRHQSKFDTCCNISFYTTLALDYMISIIGYIMFGQDCLDSVTKNLMTNSHYPKIVGPLVCALMGFIPIAKLPLVSRPLITVYENYFQINDNSVIVYKNGKKLASPITFKKFFSRLLYVGFLFMLSLAFTSFGKVVAFLGSAICFTICVTLPLCFYLRLFGDDLSSLHKLFLKVGITLGIAGAVLGTYGTIVYRGNI